MPKIQFNFKHFFAVLAISSFLLGSFFVFYSKTFAATGINRTINFQGKLVTNPQGTNVSDTTYTVVFTLYNNPTAGQGTALWTETQTVTTVDGIFRVALGSVTPIPSNFNFNWDGLYLGIKVNSDSEMTPRVQMAAVPFAFNAQQVAGLTVQDTSGNASTSGTLQVANGVTVKLQTSGTGLIYADTATTGNLSILTNSATQTGSVVGLNLTLSGATSNYNQYGIQFNLSGTTAGNQFDLYGTGGNWNISSAGILTAKGLTLSTGAITLGGSTGTGTQCLLGGAIASWGSCGSSTGINWWNQLAGALSPVGATDDLLLGGTSTASALFSFTGIQTGSTIASVSGQLVVMANNGYGGNATISGALTLGAFSNGVIQTTKNQQLTLGGATTGSIQLSPKGTTGLYVDPLGNVGIGTTATVSQLQVSANTLYSNSETSKHGFMITSGDTLSANTEFYMGADDTNSLSYLQSVGHSGFRKLILQGRGGNVSIGTTTNSNKLDVNGAASFGTYAGTVAPTNGLIVSGQVGIGTSSVLASLDVRPNITNGGTIAVASVSGSTSFASLVVDNSSVGDIFTASSSGATRFVISQNGAVTIGNSTDGLVFNAVGGGPIYSGAARPTKIITLSPEYAGATLTASGSATTNGSMTADASPSALFRTYYEWSSTQASLQDYTVAIRITIPQDFSAWDPTSAITIEFNTATTNAPQNKFDLLLFNSNDAKPTTPVVMRTANVSSVAKTWQTLTIPASALTGGTAVWNIAGHTATIYLKMYAVSPAYVQVGDINLKYLSKF